MPQGAQAAVRVRAVTHGGCRSWADRAGGLGRRATRYFALFNDLLVYGAMVAVPSAPVGPGNHPRCTSQHRFPLSTLVASDLGGQGGKGTGVERRRTRGLGGVERMGWAAVSQALSKG